MLADRELYSGERPYYKKRKGDMALAPNFGKFPASCPQVYKHLALQCMQLEPKARPSFVEIAAQLNNMLRAWELGQDNLVMPQLVPGPIYR